ncbi:MAG TPA: 2-oxoacid:acceptor oxidoreductase subunit alpha [bacterium]|nr:2-oxoacid:acceptor oxidoreductase subunit alpha [bacterium]
MKDISILITGQAGQGIQTVETVLSELFLQAGYNVFATKEYMSRVRGGANSTEIRISQKPVRACVDRIDILLALDDVITETIAGRINENTLVIGENIRDLKGMNEKVGFTSMARELGNPVFSNVVATGAALAVLNIGIDLPLKHIEKIFSKKGRDIVEKNLAALKKGYEAGDAIRKRRAFPNFSPQSGRESQFLVNGTQAVGLGAIAGGCNFISAYPMSPSTGVFTFLAERGKKENIIVEQAEDEISAVNMVLGASYAGSRGLVNTSGGGFALMEEGISLAGMTETPVVIHIAQRPGPATGLPTRTEQGDFNLALYSGHGEFPRIIFAPGRIEEAFVLTQRAFDLADKYQVPVFILTDQYFLDSYYNLPRFPEAGEKAKKGYIVKTGRDYKRYLFTENGVSPRGIPGYGDGFVCVDSDEHDENGRITEDMDIRRKMVEKRWKKLALVKEEIISPEFYGDREYRVLLIGWGSTFHIIKEAVNNIGTKGIGVLHFSQLYPLSKDTEAYLGRAEKVISIESNFAGQFADFITAGTGCVINHRINKYTGLPFSVEEMESSLRKEL